MSTVLLPASSPSIERSGRWHTSKTGSLIASWCGASLKFLHTGQSLSIKVGPLTERKDRFNGGTPMLACVISQSSKDEEVMLLDFEPSQTLELFVAKTEEDASKQRVVELTLIDWASILEIEAFICPSADSVQRPPHYDYVRSLHIGDSISCGLSDGSTPIARGCLDAFPFVTRDALRKEGLKMEIDMVAFPGASLTDPTQEEIDAEMNIPKGLEKGFLHHPFPNFTEEEDGASAESSPESSLGVHVPSFVDNLRTAFPQVVISGCDIGKGMKEESTMDGLHPTIDGQAILVASWLDEARKIVKSISDMH
ncbi:hypothetical protein DXG01_010751 [Tephrocybe rancida]|nr:hypothetical protein DXG01_010751 [Tephrocybe rancida]